MASCPKCGKRHIRKSKDGLKRCRHCGLLTNGLNLLRNGLRLSSVDVEDQAAIGIKEPEDQEI